MTHSATVINQSEIMVTAALAGLALGLVYFAALKCSVRLLVGDHRRLGSLALMLGRIGAAAGLFFGAAKLGAGPLLAAFLGFLIARTVALRGLTRAG